MTGSEKGMKGFKKEVGRRGGREVCVLRRALVHLDAYLSVSAARGAYVVVAYRDGLVCFHTRLVNSMDR